MDAGPVGSLCHPVLAFVCNHLPSAYLVEKKAYLRTLRLMVNYLCGYVYVINLGHVIQTESWILRALTFIFARSAKRGHRPREPQIRDLMVAADIPVPVSSPRSSLSSAGSAGSHVLIFC